ncbi:HPF/RaiA family ribosome-associated protein [Variovorax sp. KK3]|uniref:HPF/RaiA family ribosome-associated protein n=1 Tax=Variovorax sp. KK3 TaxID=1855728 RepID=UPI00097BBEFF|nr:HPF/RaiA family ribosome-associated protein [Variovorax sp. KK3]
MEIQLNTSNGVENKESLDRWADEQIRQSFDRFAGDVTRVEVHLSDENHDKGGSKDKRCAMEARVTGHPPVAVTQHAPTIDEAFRGASDKLKRALDSMLGRQERRRDRVTIRKDGDALVEEAE